MMAMRRHVPLLVAVVLTLTVFGTPPAGAAAPPNDMFADAAVLSGTADSAVSTTVDATKEAGEPDHAGISGGASIWFRWQAPSDGLASVELCGSDYDTLLGVYTGAAVDALTEVAANDDYCGAQSGTTFDATSGTVYRIAVDGFGGLTGGVVLQLTLSPPSASSSGSLEVASSVDFGRVAVGKSVTKTVLLRNVGEGPLTISSVSLRKYPFASTEYKIAIDDATGTTISSGDSRRVVLRFTPSGNASGKPRPRSYFDVPTGLSLLKYSYVYDDLDPNFVAGRYWHYFRNLGGRGSVTYRVAASNDYGDGFVVKGAKQDTATLRAGDYYAVAAVSPYGIGSADQAAQELFAPVGTSLSRQVFTPLWPDYTVTALNGVKSVSLHRLGDAVLLIDSSDPTPRTPGDPYRFANDDDALTVVRILGESRAVCPGYADDARNQVVGTAGNDTLIGTNGPDIICGLGGDDVLRGKGGRDLLLGGSGDDIIRARDGTTDVVNGGAGRDTGFVDRTDRVRSIERIRYR
jgi:Ca2+-binding RTX toxin-like protein